MKYLGELDELGDEWLEHRFVDVNSLLILSGTRQKLKICGGAPR